MMIHYKINRRLIGNKSTVYYSLCQLLRAIKVQESKELWLRLPLRPSQSDSTAMDSKTDNPLNYRD